MLNKVCYAHITLGVDGVIEQKLGTLIRIAQEINDEIVGVVKFEQEITNLDLITDKIIHNAYSSFLATCKVCVELNGECLNRQWEKFKKKS